MVHLLMVKKFMMQAMIKRKIIGANDEDSHSVFVVASFNGLVRSVRVSDFFHFRVVIEIPEYFQCLAGERQVLQTNKERNNKANNFENSRLSTYRQRKKQTEQTSKQTNK